MLSKSLSITWKFHILYHPQSSGKVERANVLIKQHLTKLTLEAKLHWKKLLPIAFLHLCALPGKTSSLSSFELRYSPSRTAHHCLPAPDLLPAFHLTRDTLHKYTESAIPKPIPTQDSPLLQPKDWIWVTSSPSPLKPKWKDLYQVILTPPTAAKLKSFLHWIYNSPLPSWPST